MAGVYKAGTLYVDVVPSMRGFFKSVEADAKAQLPNIGKNAGKDFADGLRSGVGSSGAQVAKSISQPIDAAATEGDPQLIGASGAVVCHWLSHLLSQRYAMPRIPTPHLSLS